MEFRRLNTFRTVAAELSFTRAAARLGYVQSAVTSHIKALEDELGVRLFDRLGRRIMLTHAGSQLLCYAGQILQLADEATAMVSQAGEPTGPVIVSAPEMLCAYRLPPVIRELHRQHPGIQLLFRSNPTGALDSSLRHALADGDIDAAIVLDENLTSTDSLNVEHLTSEPLVVVAAPQHPLAHAPAIGPADLDGVPVLLTEKGCGYRPAGPPPQPRRYVRETAHRLLPAPRNCPRRWQRRRRPGMRSWSSTAPSSPSTG